jgi:hypothetical protein
MSVLMESLAASQLWLSVRRTAENGRQGRDFQVRSAAGVPLLRAHADNWQREIAVRQQLDGLDTPAFMLRRRRLFPVNGVVDILDPDAERIGIVRRSLRFAPTDGQAGGRWRDARSLRAHTGEAVLAAVVDTVLSGDGGSEVSGPRS